MQIHKIAILLSLFLCVTFYSCKHSNKNANDGNVPKELALLNEAISNDSTIASNFTRRGEYYQKHEQLNNALADIKKAISLDPKDSKAYKVLSDIYLMMGSPQESLDALKKVIQYDKDNTEILISMAKLYLIMKDYENCAKSVETALKIDERLPLAYYIKGMALMENEKMDEAIKSFQKAVSIDQKQYEALMQLGYIFNTRDKKIAIEYFKSATLAQPDAIEAFYNLGLLYQENEQPFKAIEAYNSILKLDSTNKLALYNIGYVNLVYNADYKKAESFFDRATKVDTAYADAFFNRGYSKELQGRYAEARADFRKVLKMRVNDPKAIEGLNRLDKVERK